MDSSILAKIESEIIDVFASISGSLGYSEVHGKILAALLISGETLSLEKLAKKTRYSASMISLSLDLLEVLGMVKKVKKPGDRKLYLQLEGDLLESLKTAIMFKLIKGLAEIKSNFRQYREEIHKIDSKDKKKLLKSLKILETQIKRIGKYADRLSKVKIPR